VLERSPTYARYPATLVGKPSRDRRPGLHSAGEVSTLFIAHRHSIRNRRHRGYIGAFLEPTSDYALLDWGATLVSNGDCWLTQEGWI
jgi:hypothetical protein